MASVLVEFPRETRAMPFVIVEQRRTTLTPGLEENIAHGGPDGVAPISVRSTTVVAPIANDPVLFTWIKDDSNTTNNTIRVKWDTTAGGSLDSAEVMLECEFPASASGGISP